MIGRHITTRVEAALKDTPVVFLHGARQTGKSTLVQSWAMAEGTYLTFDDETTLAAAAADPAGFVAAAEGLMILDEVQKVPEIFPAIKQEVDRDRRPGRFLLTGSANVLLVPRVSESLAGRVELLTLRPLSQGELHGVCEGFVDALFGDAVPRPPAKCIGKPALFDRIVAGGYPEVCTVRTKARRPDWFRSYVSTILQRDVRDLSNIEGLTDLPRLLSLLAARAGGLLNFAEVARDLAMPQSTLKRYFALLEMTFLVQPLRAWSTNLGTRLVKSPKLYLNDTGLLSHLIGFSPDRLALEPQQAGRVLENFVVMELRKQISWSRTRPDVFHFRTPPGREVDILLEDRAGRIVGIEVKSGATLRTDDVKGLRKLAELAGERFHRGIVLYLGHNRIPFGPRIHALPIDTLWTSDE